MRASRTSWVPLSVGMRLLFCPAAGSCRSKSARTITVGGPIANAGQVCASVNTVEIGPSCLQGRRRPGKGCKRTDYRAMAKSAREPPSKGKSPQEPPDPAELARIADALERLAPGIPAAADFGAADAFAWHPAGRRLAPVARVNRVEMSLLKGIDRVRDLLVENTERFASGLPANNALLWGARGMGKSSLVKAVHAAVNAGCDGKEPPLKLIEIHREEIESLPELMTLLRAAAERFVVFCDDLSFDANDTSY